MEGAMKGITAVLAAALIIAPIGASAFAADMALKAPPSKPVAYSWSGCYFGGNLGGLWARNSTSVGLYDPVPNNSGLTGLVAAGAIPVGFGYDGNSWIAGGQAGCNYQRANLVVGIESDLDALSLNAGQTLNPPSPFAVRYTSTVTSQMNWFGTTRARIGTTWNNLLFYATGGAAYARVSNSYFLSDVPSTGIISISTADSSTRIGWTIGGGVEAGFGAWSVKGEALWYDLGGHTLSAPCATTAGPPTCSTPNAVLLPNYQNRGVVARLGLNYHFGPMPVRTP
jgi:outer membrane immunogenic protein